jgi:hypothetical protein
MPTQSFDSSTLTQFRRARALYSFNAARNAAVQAGLSTRPSQGGGLDNDVRVQTNLGGPTQIVTQFYAEQGCACTAGAQTINGFPVNTSTQ